MCWCAGTDPSQCSQVPDYRVDFGRVTVVGPRYLESGRTCVSGQTCVFEGITGTSLTKDDHVMVLETCGSTFLVPKLWTEGHKLASAFGSRGFGIESDVVSAPGGLYRLCWCNGSQSHCEGAEEYQIGIGQPSIIGPSLQQDRTCVSGRRCRLDGIHGIHL